MMRDIVETLRAAAKHPANGHGPQEWLNEAADEIAKLRADLAYADEQAKKLEAMAWPAMELNEKLRAALDKMKRSRDRYRQAWEAEKARAALGGGDD